MSSVVTKFEELGYPIGTEGNINVLDVEFNSTTIIKKQRQIQILVIFFNVNFR